MTNGEGDEGDVGWSPDGKSVVFACMTSCEGHYAIHLLDLTTLKISTFLARKDSSLPAGRRTDATSWRGR